MSELSEHLRKESAQRLQIEVAKQFELFMKVNARHPVLSYIKYGPENVSLPTGITVRNSLSEPFVAGVAM